MGIKTRLNGDEYRACKVCGDFCWMKPGEDVCCLCQHEESKDEKQRDA